MANKTYLFRCKYCGARFESLSKPWGHVRCPECNTSPCEPLEQEKEE